jgi:orotidine-5'-phosphate decarboxylase
LKVNKSPIIIALDYPNPAQALEFAARMDVRQCRLKIGKELFTRGGPALVDKLVTRGFDVFLDLKFHDIPNTVARACAAAADLGVWMMNVHALGGRKMMEAARTALSTQRKPPVLLAVTILTSLDEQDISEVGLAGTVAQNVVRLAGLARQAGMDGVVCSPRELACVRESSGEQFCLVTPGIRPHDAASDDQKRTMTPIEALRAGADYLVIGRPITAAADPVQALRALQSEIEQDV